MLEGMVIVSEAGIHLKQQNVGLSWPECPSELGNVLIFLVNDYTQCWHVLEGMLVCSESAASTKWHNVRIDLTQIVIMQAKLHNFLTSSLAMHASQNLVTRRCRVWILPIWEWNNIQQTVHTCLWGYIPFLPDALHLTHQLLNLELQRHCNMNRHKTQCQWCRKLYASARALSNNLTKVHLTETSQNIDKPRSSKHRFSNLSSPELLKLVLNLELVTGTFFQNYDHP